MGGHIDNKKPAKILLAAVRRYCKMWDDSRQSIYACMNIDVTDASVPFFDPRYNPIDGIGLEEALLFAYPKQIKIKVKNKT